MKKSTVEPIIILFIFSILGAYVLYENVNDRDAVAMSEQIIRHNKLIAGDSEFYNPWQYRVLSAQLLESLIFISDKIFPNIPKEIPYLFLRFLQNIAIFFAAYLFYKSLKIKSLVLLLTGILIAAYQMSNSSFQSDLSFNTYFDVLFYLIAGYVIVVNKPFWIIPVTILAAFNRETSGLIPFLLVGYAFYEDRFKFKNRKNLIISIVALSSYAIVFIGLRLFYGYPPATGIHGMNSVIDYLFFNIRFFKLYPELIGTLGIIPLLTLLKFGVWPKETKVFFWILVPVWFLIHLLKSTAVETRLFLVPQLLIFIPALLYIIEHEAKKLSLIEWRQRG